MSYARMSPACSSSYDEAEDIQVAVHLKGDSAAQQEPLMKHRRHFKALVSHDGSSHSQRDTPVDSPQQPASPSCGPRVKTRLSAPDLSRVIKEAELRLQSQASGSEPLPRRRAPRRTHSAGRPLPVPVSPFSLPEVQCQTVPPEPVKSSQRKLLKQQQQVQAGHHKQQHAEIEQQAKHTGVRAPPPVATKPPRPPTQTNTPCGSVTGGRSGRSTPAHGHSPRTPAVHDTRLMAPVLVAKVVTEPAVVAPGMHRQAVQSQPQAQGPSQPVSQPPEQDTRKSKWFKWLGCMCV